MNIIRKTEKIITGPGYWWFYFLTGLFFMSTALYYQYALETLPCVLCIQIRIFISLMAFLAIIGLFLRHNKFMLVLTNLGMLTLAAALTERSYQLLGTERGFVFGDCGFDPGLPSWFALDSWFPALYQVETSCGYTPELVFGITMAEALMVFSVLFLIVSFLAFSSSLALVLKK